VKGKEHGRDNFKCGVAFGDLHVPEHDAACVDILVDFIKDFQPDYLLNMGDGMDFGLISFFNNRKPRLIENRRLRGEYTQYQNILDRLSEAAGNCEEILARGNHENRLPRYLDMYPVLEGVIEMEENLDLDRYTLLDYNEAFNIGEMWFGHGEYYNKWHAAKNVSIFGRQIFTWHVHTNQVFTLTSMVNAMPRQGVSIGCLCNKNPEYNRGKANAWLHQFMYFYVFEDGTFTYYTPSIINNRCVINGKVYSG